MLAVWMPFVMLSIINRFVHVHQVMLVHHMYNAFCHVNHRNQYGQNVKAIQNVRMIRRASMRDAKIHAHKVEFAVIMLFVMCKHIDHCVCAMKDILEMLKSLVMKVSEHENWNFQNEMLLIRFKMFILNLPLNQFRLNPKFLLKNPNYSLFLHFSWMPRW